MIVAKVAKEKLYGAKKPRKVWDVKVDNRVISELAETKSNYKLIGYLDEAIRPLFLFGIS